MEKATVAVYTDDSFLFTKIKLSAPDGITVLRGGEGVRATLTLIDADTAKRATTNAPEDKDTEVVTMSRTLGAADLTIPFSIDTVTDLLKKQSRPRPLLRLDESQKIAYLHDEPIKLTEVERALLSLLIQSRGEYVTRDEILKTVWGGEADSGVINVYVHYLRE